MFWKHYLQYALIFLALVLVMIFLSSYFIRRQRTESVRQAAAALSNYADSIITEAQRLAVNIGRSESLLTLNSTGTTQLDFTQLDSTVFFTAQKNLVSFKALNRRIESLDICLYGRQYVISDTGTITLDSFYQSVFNADPNENPEYLTPLGSRKFRFLAQGSIVEGQTPAHPLLILSLISNNTTHYGNLFLFLNEHQMGEDLSALLSDDMEYYLFDADEKLILSNSAQPKEAAGILTESEGPDARFVSAAGDLSGWNCCVGYCDEFLQHQLRIWLLLFSGLYFLILLGLFPITGMIVSRNYAPIRELSSIVDADSREGGKELEYEALKKAIRSVFENKALLEEQILIYRPLLINSLLLELLEDTGRDFASVLSGLENLGISLPFANYLCVSAVTGDVAPDFAGKISEKVSGEDTVCLYISYRRRSCSLILNSRNEKSMAAAYLALTQLLEQENQILSYGTGCTAGDIRLASASYEQSLCALEYLALKASGKGIAFDSIVRSGAQTLSRPSGLEHLEVTLSAGRFEEAEKLLMEYLDRAPRGGFVKKTYLLYAKDQLLSAIRRLQGCQQLPFEEGALASFQPDAPGSYEALYALILQICQELEALAAQQEMQSAQDSSRQILSYLEEHLCDESFSLSQLAEAFSQSESNMSRRIKQLTGQTFLAYVTQKRIDHACQLLVTTDMPILNVAKASGYENDITFRRLFKKYRNVTPGEYRSQFLS